ncbi:zinc finger protein 541 [Amia ocellicauda]|uniref:zinc finger protein 541 n=1 Tax=Amia ocellicauda TaxID=2972642 RepID=UPI0034640C76
MPFPSVLRADGQRGHQGCSAPLHYTPAPMLNPLRRGTGLYCSLLPTPDSSQESLEMEDISNYTLHPQVNVGPGFQAQVPAIQEGWGAAAEEPPREDLLWQPWPELQESDTLQEQVEAVLSLSCSSAVPGGGTNPELALHCLSRCRGDILATLEMLLLSSPQCAGDYHYCGTDMWLHSEKSLFNKAFSAHRKDFTLIQQTVQSKHVSQCVEFYYLMKKTALQQRRQREREGEWSGQPAALDTVFPNSQPIESQPVVEGVVPSPSVAGSFPCKQCGKMFYKIKSRNAHMKIHRQQEDWRERDPAGVGRVVGVVQGVHHPTAATTVPGSCPAPTSLLGRAPGCPPAPPLTLYGAPWDCRDFLEQLDLNSDPLTCSGALSPYYCDPEAKLGPGKIKYSGGSGTTSNFL